MSRTSHMIDLDRVVHPPIPAGAEPLTTPAGRVLPPAPDIQHWECWDDGMDRIIRHRCTGDVYGMSRRFGPLKIPYDSLAAALVDIDAADARNRTNPFAEEEACHE